MNGIKVSSNYQVVVPLAVRQKLGIKKGQMLYISSIGDKDMSLTTESPIDKYYGALEGIWTEDPIVYQRRIRKAWKSRP